MTSDFDYDKTERLKWSVKTIQRGLNCTDAAFKDIKLEIENELVQSGL